MQKNKYGRLKLLDNYFRMGVGYSKKTLLKKIRENEDLDTEVSIRTLEYDLEEMQNAVEFEYQRDGREKLYFYKNKHDSFFVNNENENDLILLEDLLSFSINTVTANVFNEINEQIKKLCDSYGIDTNKRIISFDRNTNLRGLSFLNNLYKAIKNECVIELAMDSFNVNKIKYTKSIVHPYFLKEFSGRWYLLGYTEMKGEKSCFPVDRIRGLAEVKDIAYRKPKYNLDYNRIFDDRIGIGEGKLIELIIKPSSFRLKYLESKKLHSSQETVIGTDGETLLKYKIIDNEELMQKLLSLGAEIEIICPISLRKRLIQRISETNKLYQKNK